MPESTFKFNGEDLTFSPEQDIGISELATLKLGFPTSGTIRPLPCKRP